MEKDGLDELMESEKKKEEQEFNDDDDDDMRSCIDIRDFERRLKSARSTRKKPSDTSSSDEDFGNNDFGNSFMSMRSGAQMRNSSKNSLNSTANQISMSKNSIQSKVQQIKQTQQQQMKSLATAQTATTAKKVLKKYDDPELEQIMKAGNIEQKVKELLNKYQQLQKNFDRERNLRQKYENEHVSQNKTRLEETSTNLSSYQSTKLGKGSILNAINNNEENIVLKQEVQRLQKELLKKDKMVSELITDKATGSIASSTSSSNGFKVFEDSKIKRLESEVKVMKKERDEFFASRFDKIYFQKNAELVKDLSYQNSKMRIKIEELEQTFRKN